MSVDYVDFLVEEPSMECVLRELLPHILGEVRFEVHAFPSKHQLLARLGQRLTGYAPWIGKEHRIVVVVDRDDDDCHALKERLEACAQEAGLPTRSRPSQGQYVVVNRIVEEELEAWYFGDWEAVRSAYPRVTAATPRRASYRQPDRIRGGTWESFERVMKRSGYFGGGLAKIEVARAIAPYLEPSRNTSPSFQSFRSAVADLARCP